MGARTRQPFLLSALRNTATRAANGRSPWGVRDHKLARDRAEAFLRVSERHNFRQWVGLGMVVGGACRVQAGETDFGLNLVEEGLGQQRQFGHTSLQGYVNTTAASAHLEAGSSGRALELLAEALDVNAKSGAGVLHPETLRLHTETRVHNFLETGH